MRSLRLLRFHRRYILPAGRGQGSRPRPAPALLALAALLLSVAAWGGGAHVGGPDRWASQLWRSYARAFGVTAPPPAVLVYPDREAYLRAARRFGVEFPRWSGGYFDCAGRVHLVRQGSLAADRVLLQHELAHALLGRCGDVPSWFHEGFAAYVAGGRRVVASPAELARRYRSTGVYLPELDFASAQPHLVYAAAGAAVQYLVATRGGERLPCLVARLNRGEGFASAFAGVYGLTPAELHAELWLHQPTAPGPAAPAPLLAAQPSSAPAAVPPAAAAARAAAAGSPPG